VFGHDHAGKFVSVFVANNFKAYTTTKVQPEHHKTVPAGDYAPAPSVWKDWPNNDANKTHQATADVVADGEDKTAKFEHDIF
jgi:hypothetical protein